MLKKGKYMEDSIDKELDQMIKKLDRAKYEIEEVQKLQLE